MNDLIERRFGEDGWRHSKYRRADGSVFHVSIPSQERPDYSRVYDENAEAQMRDEIDAVRAS